jgi:hypothetical protein
MRSECTKIRERANERERTIPPERASPRESTTSVERAIVKMKQPSVVADIVAVFISVNNMRLTLPAIGAKLRRYRKSYGRSEPPDPSIRCQLQRFCSQCAQYQDKEDLFYNPNPGVWQLRPEVYRRTY